MSGNRKTLNRRKFVARAGKIVLGAGAAGSLFSCATEPDQPTATASGESPPAADFGGFNMGFQSYSLRHFRELEEFIEQARRLQLGYVELWRGHLSPDSGSEAVAATRQRLAQAGLQVNAFGVENFSADHDQNKALFEFGKTLGVRNLSANPSKDAFDSLQQLVGEYDIRIAIHNHGPEDENWRRPEWIMDAIGDLDPRIGACADLGHFIRADVDAVDAIESLGERVLGVHLKDFDEEGNDVVLGDGRLDLAAALAALKEIGFDGPLSLEFEGDQEDPVPKMLEALKRVREALAGA